MKRFASLPFLVVAMVLLLSTTASAAGPKVYGIELVPYSRKVAPDRYQSSRDWSGTIKYFKKKFAGWKYIRWHAVVNLPHVKYVYIENTYPKRQFDGINVYVLPGGRVRMFMLKHVVPEVETVKTKNAEKSDNAGLLPASSPPASSPPASSPR